MKDPQGNPAQLRLACGVRCGLSLLILASTLAAADPANKDEMVLPPPPAYGTPASQMRLPNLKPLGDESSDDLNMPAVPVPAVAAGKHVPTPAAATTATAPRIEDFSPAASVLRKLKQRTGLSDAELAQLRAVEKLVHGADQTVALHAAQALSNKLDNDGHIYPVSDGQNLFSIAGQEGVYANSNLWPLLWWNNQPELPSPSQLKTNARLRVLAHPTIDQVNLALDYARTHNVLTAQSEDRNLLSRIAQQ